MFACGEVGGDSSSDNPTSSESNGNSSNSGNGETSSGSAISVCQGKNCCNGAEYNTEINFCVDDQLYAKCNDKTYDPYEKGCFEKELYSKCILDKTRGLCVHESLLRCRQEGAGENKIVKPIPGMVCEANGTITGVTLDIFDLVNGTPREYKTVQIGNQMWLAENVKYSVSSSNGDSKCYEDNPDNCESFGNLYDWATAMGLPSACNGTNQNCPSKSGDAIWGGICPPSFGVARSEDWEVLIEYAGGVAEAGGRLKSKTGWNNGGNGTDSYGFNALPSGYHTYLMPTEFRELGSRAIWWHETQKSSEAYYTTIISSDTEAKVNFQQKGFYMAGLRCVHYF